MSMVSMGMGNFDNIKNCQKTPSPLTKKEVHKL